MKQVLFLYDTENTEKLANKVQEKLNFNQLNILKNSPASLLSEEQSKDKAVGMVLFVSCIGPKGSTLEFIKSSKCKSWYIAIDEANGDSEDFEAVKASWEMHTRKLNVAIAKSGDISGLEQWLERLPEIFEPVCLVVSSRKGTGKTALIELLSEKCTMWKFIECAAEDFETYDRYLAYAGLIIAVGDNENDFVMKVPKDGANRFVFVLNKNDINLFNKLYSDKSKFLLSNNLQRNGWAKRPNEEYRIFSLSCLYSRKYKELTDNKITCEDLVKDPDFVIWDELFLPIPKQVNTHKFESFLSKNCGIENLIEYMTQYEI